MSARSIITAEMRRQYHEEGIEQRGVTRKGNRYFIARRFKELSSTPLRDFLFSRLMEEVCRATIGETAYLFHEQFVVKGRIRG